MKRYLVLALICSTATYGQLYPGGPTVQNITNANVSALANDVPYAGTAELLATNALLVTSISTKLTTNAVLDKVKIGDGTTLTNMTTTAQLLLTNAALAAVDAGKVATNAILDNLAIGNGANLTNVVRYVGTNATFNLLGNLDGSTLTNVTANTDASKVTTNITLTGLLISGTNLFHIVGTITNVWYGVLYAP